MASNTPFPEFKTTGDDKHDLETYIEDLTDYCIVQNWFDRSDSIRESAHENCQEHTAGTSEFYEQINLCKSASKPEANTANVTVFLVWRQLSTAPSTALPSIWQKMWKVSDQGSFRACL